MSSMRSWSRHISAASDSNVGFFGLATLPICFLAILHSINADQIFFQSEKHSQRTHAQPILVRFRSEFLHVTGEIDLQRIQPAPNVATLFFWQSSQVLSGLFFDLKPVTHCRLVSKVNTLDRRIQDDWLSVKVRHHEQRLMGLQPTHTAITVRHSCNSCLNCPKNKSPAGRFRRGFEKLN